MEYGATGKVTNTYSYAEGRVSAIIDGDTYYYLNDGRGSVSELTMTSGSTAVSYRYDIYGKTLASNKCINNPYQYNAEYTDSTTGLQYLRARYYNADTHRFQTKDTYQGNTAQPITRNNYAYANNNPVNFVDPSGHFFEQIFGFGSGVVNWAKEGVSGVASGQGLSGFKTANYDSGYDKGAAQGKALDEKLGISNNPKANNQNSNNQKSSTKNTQSTNKKGLTSETKLKEKINQAIEENKKFFCDNAQIVKDNVSALEKLPAAVADAFVHLWNDPHQVAVNNEETFDQAHEWLDNASYFGPLSYQFIFVDGLLYALEWDVEGLALTGVKALTGYLVDENVEKMVKDTAIELTYLQEETVKNAVSNYISDGITSMYVITYETAKRILNS